MHYYISTFHLVYSTILTLNFFFLLNVSFVCVPPAAAYNIRANHMSIKHWKHCVPTLSVSTPVINSCSTVRLSKKASDAVSERENIHLPPLQSINSRLTLNCMPHIHDILIYSTTFNSIKIGLYCRYILYQEERQIEWRGVSWTWKEE